jgi:hypothetical protein
MKWMKKIKDLAASDFPDVNQVEFSKWHKEAIEQNKYTLLNSIFLCIGMLLYLILQNYLPKFTPIILFILFLIIGLGILFPRRFRIDKHRREMGIDDNLLKSKLKN